MGTLATTLFYCCWLSLAFSANAANPLVVPWSTRYYGPDGPWQAVHVKLGGNDSSLTIGAQRVPTADTDLYPGGEWSSGTIQKQACDSYPNTLCGEGGSWDPDKAALYEIAWREAYTDDTYGLQTSKAYHVRRALTIDSTTLWNASLVSWEDANITYFNGKVGGRILGNLALGAITPEHAFQKGDAAGSNVTTWTIPGGLYHQGNIPSWSYGLHIGAAAFGYPGSLLFGGYNQGRVINPVTSFSDPDNKVDLLDLSIGVTFGGSPFDFDSKKGLLLNTSDTGTQMKVQIDATTPYLSLPSKTCEGLAKILPIQFDTTLKYYTWNTTNPKFKEIVTSPAYLGFTFPPAPGTTQNVVIKVPFALLNLTLDKPITNTPTQYFPCHPYDGSQPRLGRAFLQAAFIGRNWNSKTTWLAQAPGPGPANLGLGDVFTTIQQDDISISGPSNSNPEDQFKASWDGHWSILNNTAPNSTSSGHNSTSSGQGGGGSASAKSGLPIGAKAGIGVAVPVAVLALVGLGFVLWRRRMRNKQKTYPAFSDPAFTDSPPEKDQQYVNHTMGYEHQEMQADRVPQEMQARGEAQELPDRNDPRMR